MSEMTVGTRSRRFRRTGVGILAAMALTVGFLAAGSPGGAQATSPFLLSDYGTDVIDSEGSYCWRGVGFSPNSDLSVTALVGGGINGTDPDDELGGALFAITFDEATGDYTLDSVLASVTFPEGEEVSVDLTSPVAITAGEYYILGMGSVLEGSDSVDASMARVENFDSSTIAGASNLMGAFLPEVETNTALNLPDIDADSELCNGDPAGMVGETANIETTTETVPAVGFAYTTPPAPAPEPEPVTPAFTG